MKIFDFHMCNGVMVYWCNGEGFARFGLLGGLDYDGKI